VLLGGIAGRPGRDGSPTSTARLDSDQSTENENRPCSCFNPTSKIMSIETTMTIFAIALVFAVFAAALAWSD
jgi:hypothetical protein